MSGFSRRWIPSAATGMRWPGTRWSRARWTGSFPALPAEHQPPKGLQESTLELVRACLRAAPPQGLPSEALSRQTGLQW